MIASMFNLDHRLTELGPTADERRLARVRAAAALATGNPRRVLDVVRERLGAASLGIRPSRVVAG